MFLLPLLIACTEAPEPAALIEMACNRIDDPALSPEEANEATEACYKLGTEQLNAARPNYTEARRLLANACNTHHPRACNALGTLVRDARGGPKDLVRAADLFEVACEKGISQGCVHFADALAIGAGKPQDVERAEKLYREACESDVAIPKACTSLGIMIRDKRGARRADKEEATALFEKACKVDFPSACVQLADDLEKAWGKDNIARAAELYETACTIDPNFGCYQLAEMHESGKAPDANIEQAGRFYQAVCRIDSSRGCYELAELMSAEKVPSRPGEKEALYKLSCESGNTEACTKR
jgi:hypothetical protein